MISAEASTEAALVALQQRSEVQKLDAHKRWNSNALQSLNMLKCKVPEAAGRCAKIARVLKQEARLHQAVGSALCRSAEHEQRCRARGAEAAGGASRVARCKQS
jgi:hypothetical protein